MTRIILWVVGPLSVFFACFVVLTTFSPLFTGFPGYPPPVWLGIAAVAIFTAYLFFFCVQMVDDRASVAPAVLIIGLYTVLIIASFGHIYVFLGLNSAAMVGSVLRKCSFLRVQKAI